MEFSDTLALASFSNEKLTDKAYKEIEELIVTLQLKPGQILSEIGLAKHLGIGRTPIREALQQLSREGLVNILPRRGIVVSDLNVRNQLDLLMLRREVERLTARLACTRATREEATAFADVAEAMLRSGEANDDIEFMRQDRQLNGLLLAACQNEFARRTMGLMQGLSRRFWYLHYRKSLELRKCARLHADLASAVGKRDPDAAVAASDKLIDYLEEVTRSLNEGSY